MPNNFHMRLPCSRSTALIVTVVFVSCSTYFLLVQAEYAGFTMDLIHRDSPKSPLHNPLLTPLQRLNYSFRRSLYRATQFESSSVSPSGGEYLTKISYGTPPVETLAIIDTSSAVTWTQCLPCTTCSKGTFPLFDRRNSSTYEVVYCSTRKCDAFGTTICGQNGFDCDFYVFYSGNSYTYGKVATDTITFEASNREKVSFPNFVFGCGQSGTFPEMGSGTVGLGFRYQSLVSQLNSSIHGKFSYCFGTPTDVSKPGKIRFGDNPVFLGEAEGVISTPLTFSITYSLRLEAITVANKRLEYHIPHETPSSTEANIFIDSGTPYTFLPTDLYDDLKTIMRNEIGSQNIVENPEYNLTLCYSSLLDSDIPNVTLHFRGGDLKLNPENIFDRTSPSVVCLGFVPNDIGILGNIIQANSWVEYDLNNKIISFKRAECSQ